MDGYTKKLIRMWCGRFMLILLGIVGSLVVLEFFLMVFGALVASSSNDDVSNSQVGHRPIVIATIGESTTARLGDNPPWPELLEHELNARLGTGSARVVNLAQAGSQTDLLVKRLMRDVPRTKPDIVISMMGINDDVVYGDSESDSFSDRIYDSHVYRFLSIIVRMVASADHRTLLSAAQQCHGSDSFGQKEWNAMLENRMPSGVSGNSSAPLDPTLIPVIEDFIARYPFAYVAYDVLIHNLPYEHADAVPTKWADTLYWADRFLDAEPFIKLCITKSSLMSDSERLNRLSSVDSRRDAIAQIRDLARVNVEAQKKGEVIQEIDEKRTKKALGITQPVQAIDTAANYRKVATFLAQNNVQYMAMQYPLTSVSAIQDMLEAIDGVVYIENEDNFYTMLMTHTYEDLFIDNFAGSFGHTTLLGSSLIASNAADTVVKSVIASGLLR